MPRAREQSSVDAQKPPAGKRFKTKMHTSTQPPVTRDGLVSVKANLEFDLWLQRELCRLHGDVLHEPVPDRLLRVLEDAGKPLD